MTESQNTAVYYVRKRGKLIGPLSMERISYCCSCRLLSKEDEISSDQVDWTTISAYKAYLQNQADNSNPQGNHEEDIKTENTATLLTPESYSTGVPESSKQEQSILYKYRFLILILLAAVMIGGLFSVGAYFAYNYFSGSTFVTTDVKNLYEVLLWEDSLNKKKKTGELLWKKARELAQKGNLMLAEAIFRKRINPEAADPIPEKKYRKEIFNILLQKNDPWAKWVELAGEEILVCDFLGKKATSSDRSFDQKHEKTYICVPMQKIQLDEVHKLISQTDNINLLILIVARMDFMNKVWQRVEGKNAKSPYKHCIHLISRRLEELHFNAFAYYVDATYYYSKGTHDHLTVMKKLQEENRESEKFKLEVLDFQGKGFFIVHNGTIQYKHLHGKHPYRAKIDGKTWDTSSKYVLLGKNLAANAMISNDENIKSCYFKKKLYIIPQKPGVFNAQIQVFKRLDLTTE